MSPAEDPQPEQPSQEHPTNGLDETVHQRHRLGILTITAEAQRAEFGYLREALSLTPGNLSKHLTVLEQAGMIEVEDVRKGLRARGCHTTWSVAGRR
jgi:DNA-binding MarR family transcriptional regulator